MSEGYVTVLHKDLLAAMECVAEMMLDSTEWAERLAAILERDVPRQCKICDGYGERNPMSAHHCPHCYPPISGAGEKVL